MQNNKPFEPDDQDLPEGWDPAAEVDPQLETVFRLATESAAPAEDPRPAAIEGLRLATRRQLFAERLIHADDLRPRSSKSFAANLRKVFFGGGASAQLLRLGVTAGLAFAVGTGFVVSEVGEANKPAVSPVREIAVPAATPSTRLAQKNQESIAAETRVVASAPDEKSSAPRQPLNGVMINRSAVTDIENGWKSTAPTSRGWMSQGGVAVSDESYPPTSMELGVDELQMLKMNALANGDASGMSKLRSLEQTLTQVMVQYDENKEQPKVTALQRMQKADALCDAHRYRDAIEEFERVQQLAPGAPMALISEFAIGQIAFEKLDDFELAQEAFQNCKDKYQGINITPEAQNYVNSRLEILKGTAGNNWANLAAWRSAERATTAKEASANLLRIVADCEYLELASRAAVRLRDYALGPNTALDVDPEQISQALAARVKASSPGHYTAKTQCALADITLYSAGNFELAAEQYRAAQTMSPDAETVRLIQSRLAQIAPLTGRVTLPASQ
ncbi:MAG: hypothetical protein ABI579_05675 [Candidatus Sumerlaeota bacterium]